MILIDELVTNLLYKRIPAVGYESLAIASLACFHDKYLGLFCQSGDCFVVDSFHDLLDDDELPIDSADHALISMRQDANDEAGEL